MFYRLCDLVLRSNVPLPELPPAAQTTADLDFELLPAGELEEVAAEWFHRREFENGRVWLTFARLGAGYLLRFPRYADFTVLDDARRVDCRPRPGVPPTTLHHLLLDQVLPLVLSKRGGLVLHASAVTLPEGVIAFLGDTGRGKSTLAASLAQRGFGLVTDDCLVVRERGRDFWGFPSYPGLRVLPDTLSALFNRELNLPQVAHYTQKMRLRPDHAPLAFEAQPKPLRKIYFLGEPKTGEDQALITPVSTRDGLVQLIGAVVRLDCQNRDDLLAEFETCSRLVKSTAPLQLTLPRDYTALGRVCEVLLADSGAGS
jgi:hypothetical protein